MEGRQVDPLGAVYAEALAGLAESDGGRDALREVGERLSAFAEAWREDRTLRAYFLSADVRFSDKERAMEKLGAAQPNVLSRFLRLLLQRGRLTWFPQIADAYEAILDRTLGRIPVTL
ncbi:MAG: F0F1 ATP synthase subunit delta, partial [Planctomycetota bacterium]